MSPNMKAFLDAIAWSEIGAVLLSKSDNGYNVLVGATPAVPLLFKNYVSHPMIYSRTLNSDAAGRYQFMGRYWPHYKIQLGLPDFGPASQDRWAIQLIRECKAQDDVEAGHFGTALTKCRSRWASLPGAGYGQHENDIADLQAAYTAAGGTIA
jgi:muramidase (phage lysozyme)